MFQYRKAFFFFFLSYCYSAIAQKHNERYQLHITRASSPVIIDGLADEKAWQDAEIAGNFFMVLPMDTSFANNRTDVRMTYDDHHLYIVAECFHHLPGPYMVESLRRDFNFTKNDNFIFFMDYCSFLFDNDYHYQMITGNVKPYYGVKCLKNWIIVF